MGVTLYERQNLLKAEATTKGVAEAAMSIVRMRATTRNHTMEEPMFEPVGDYDETSFFHMFRDPRLVALDQSIKANRQLAQVQSLAYAAPGTQAKTVTQEARIAELEQRCLALGLHAQAMAQLLVTKGIATPDELREAVVDLDLLDGKLDGR